MKWCRLIPALLVLALSANAQSLRKGDLLWVPGCMVCPPTWPKMTIYTPTVEAKDLWQLRPESYGPIVTAPDKTIVAGAALDRYSQNGDYLGSYPLAARALTFDRAGVLLATDGSALYRMTSGEVLETIPFPAGITDGDLAGDQCTFVYIAVDFPQSRMLRRYDICSHAELESLAVPQASTAKGLRLLRDGTILFASEQSLFRLASDGTVLLRHSFGDGVGGFALAPGAASIWVRWYDYRGGARLLVLDTATFAVLRDKKADPGYYGGYFAVYGELRASYDVGNRSRRVRRP